MYTLSDEMRGGGGNGSGRNREPSPFLGNDVRALGSARRQANNTFTPNGGVNFANARRQGNDTFTPGGGINLASNRTNTMTTNTSTVRKKKAAAAASDDENPFRLPPLSSAEKAYMVRKAKESSIALVDHAHTLDGPVEWQYTGKFRGIQMYRGEGARTEEDGMEYLCGVTTMMGTLAEVSAYFDQSTTERMRAKKADDVLDCAVLYALAHGSSSKNPFYRVAVKYTSFEGPSTFSRARDYVYLECQDTFRHASGRRGWVLSMHSIKLPNCPEMDGTVRGSMYHSGYVFVEAERPGYMDVMHSLQINFRATKRLPSFMLHSALKRRITSVIKISREIQVARMGAHTLLRKQDLMPKNSRSVCANCARKFTLFIRKTRCRMCGQVVCQSCAPQVDWDVPTNSSGGNGGGGKKKTRICVQCYRTGGGLLAPSSTATSKNSAEYSDDDDELADHDHAHEDDGDDDAAAASDDGLEEQTEESAFAQSRFTRSAESLISFSSDFHIHDLGASKVGGGAKGGGAIGWKDMGGTSYDQPPNVLEDSTFDADMSYSSNFYETKRFLTPEDTDEELDKRARRYDPDFRTTSISHQPDTSRTYGAVPPPPPLSPGSQFSVGALKEHNQRLQSAKKFTGPTPLPPAPALLAHQSSGKLVSIKDIRSNFLKGTIKGELPSPAGAAAVAAAPDDAASGYDEQYISRPPSAILSKVRANRSRTIQFAPEGDYRSPEMMQSMQDEHAKRMAELSTATAAYNVSLRVQEPERNSADDTPFTLEQLEVPAPTVSVTTVGAAGGGYDCDDIDYETAAATASASAADDDDVHDAEDYYTPVSALELSQVRANRSQTIEFMPQFLADAPAEDAADGEDEVAVSPQAAVRTRTTPRQSTERTRQQQRRQAPSSPLSTRSSDEPRVTEQYASLQIPMGEIVEMAGSPMARRNRDAEGPETPEHDNDSAQRMRFSQTMIPILDFAASQRSSDLESPSRLTLELAARDSRKFSDIPLLARSTSDSSVRESDLDLELLSRSTTVIMDQVRAGRSHLADFDESDYDRSTEIMKDIEEEHRRRMAELNALALDYTGNRISRLHLVDEDCESLDAAEYDGDDTHRRSSLDGKSLAALQPQPQQLQPLQLGSLDEDTDECEPFAASSAAVRASETSNSESDDDDVDDVNDGAASQRSIDFGGAHARISSPRGGCMSDDDRDGARLTSLEFMPEDTEISADVNAPAPAPAPSRFTNLAFSLDLLEPRDAVDAQIGSPRASSIFDDELLNRSTAVIMDQVRARRVPVAADLTLSDSQMRSTAIMHDKEAEHRARMAELNALALAHVGERVSTFASRESEDATGDRSLLQRVNTTHLDGDFRATAVLDRYQSAHDAKMQALRAKVRELDDACRASMASIFSADELDFADLNDDPIPVVAAPEPKAAARPKYRHRDVPPPVATSSRIGRSDENSSRIANLYSVAHLKPVATRRAPVSMHERVSSATLYQQIAQLTQLQSQMALAEDAEDEEAFKRRIKEQYQLLRTLKLRGY